MTKTRRASYPGMNIRTAAAPMIAVATQPRITITAGSAVKAPITDSWNQQDNDHHKRHGDDPVDHRAPEQCFHRADRRILDDAARQAR